MHCTNLQSNKSLQRYLFPFKLGPVGHSRLQPVHLGHDEADVAPQRVGALLQLHLLAGPRILLPKGKRLIFTHYR